MLVRSILVAYLVIGFAFSALADDKRNVQPNSGPVKTKTLKPVMVIRFNNPEVEFERAAKRVIDQAVRTKSNIVFKILPIVKVTNNVAIDEAERQLVANNVAKLRGIMLSNRVPHNHIVILQAKGVQSVSEIKVFVQ